MQNFIFYFFVVLSIILVAYVVYDVIKNKDFNRADALALLGAAVTIVVAIYSLPEQQVSTSTSTATSSLSPETSNDPLTPEPISNAPISPTDTLVPVPTHTPNPTPAAEGGILKFSDEFNGTTYGFRLYGNVTFVDNNVQIPKGGGITLRITLINKTAVSYRPIY